MRIRFISYQNLPRLSLVVIFFTMLYTIAYFHPWTRNKNGERGVIKWDVITYYSYLPATVIHGDVTLEFLAERKIKNDNKFWPVKLDNGNRLIVTTMGLSFLYTPYFLAAHALAPLLGQENDGFSNIYQFMLLLGGFIYAFTGLILLSRFLRKHFDAAITALTLLIVGLGTNLFFYSTIEAAMPHSHNFFLITLFLLLTDRWYRQPTWYFGLLTGALFGLIVLVRPTNILLFLFLFLYGVTSWKTMVERIRFYLERWQLVLLMLAGFMLPWIPQLLYWKAVTGHYLFYSYGEKNASFFFGQPKILKSLFHIRKGWLVYTPLMAFALIGIPMLYRKHRGWFIPLVVYVPLMIYVQSSWWCWWFGGGFGLRSYISMYPLLAIPLAVFLTRVFQWRRSVYTYGLVSLLLLLVGYQVFQTRQFTTQAIHYSGTTVASYKANFLRTRPTKASWKLLELPDFNLARLGIHVSYPTGEDKAAWRAMDREEAQQRIRSEIAQDKRIIRQIERYAERESIAVDSAMQEVVERMYERKTN
jgi:hypothetical protein